MSRIKEALQNAKEVYFMLEDKHSKEIFLNRFLYLITGDLDYFKKNPGQERFNENARINAFGDPFISDELCNEIKGVPGELIIYGAGVLGTKIFPMLLAKGLEVSCFWDKDSIKQAAGHCGKKVVPPPCACIGNEKIIIGSEDYETEMVDYLLSIGVAKERIFKSNYNKILYDVENQYFEPEIIRFSEDEIFVDAGCFDFESIEKLLEKCSSVKRIYAFEPEKKQFDFCKIKQNEMKYSNVTLYNAGLWNKSDTLYFRFNGSSSSILNEGHTLNDYLNYNVANKTKVEPVKIKVVTLDETVDDKVTFIKMDIEGSELEALKGSEKTIIKHKPKLAVCVYHKAEDIIDIPLYIKSLVPEYKLYMRHYTNSFGETVLYAVT